MKKFTALCMMIIALGFVTVGCGGATAPAPAPADSAAPADGAAPADPAAAPADAAPAQ